MAQHISPYHAPDFYKDALAKGRHRDIVGGRWDETGRIQMQLLLEAGLQPQHHLLDIGAGSLRLGCKAVPYLNPGHYWATDLSGALLRKGYEAEITATARLSADHLIEDTFPPTTCAAPCCKFAHGFPSLKYCCSRCFWRLMPRQACSRSSSPMAW